MKLISAFTTVAIGALTLASPSLSAAASGQHYLCQRNEAPSDNRYQIETDFSGAKAFIRRETIAGLIPVAELDCSEPAPGPKPPAADVPTIMRTCIDTRARPTAYSIEFEGGSIVSIVTAEVYEIKAGAKRKIATLFCSLTV